VVVALELDVGALPEALDVALVPFVDAGKPVLERTIEGPRRPGADLEGFRLVRVVVAQILAEGERRARLGSNLEHHPGDLVLAADVGRERARGLDAVIHAAAERETRALRAEAQDRAQVLRAGAGRLQHPADEALPQARIGGVDRQRLTVDQLGRHDQVGIRILERDLVADRDEVAMR
jgi:hypothetical protein